MPRKGGPFKMFDMSVVFSLSWNSLRFTQDSCCSTTDLSFKALTDEYFRIHSSKEVASLKMALLVYLRHLPLLKMIHDYVGWIERTPPYLLARTQDRTGKWEMHDFVGFCFKTLQQSPGYPVLKVYSLTWYGGVAPYVRCPESRLAEFLPWVMPESGEIVVKKMKKVVVDGIKGPSGIHHRQGIQEWVRWVTVAVHAQVPYSEKWIQFLILVIQQTHTPAQAYPLIRHFEKVAGDCYFLHYFLGMLYQTPKSTLGDAWCALQDLEKAMFHFQKLITLATPIDKIYLSLHVANICLEAEEYDRGILALTSGLPLPVAREYPADFNGARYQILAKLYTRKKDLANAEHAASQALHHQTAFNDAVRASGKK